MEEWLPELKTAILSAQQSLEDCKYVGGLVSYTVIIAMMLCLL